MKCFAHDILKSNISEKKYDVITECAKILSPNQDRTVVIQEYGGSDIRVFTRDDKINVLCPKHMTVIQENALTASIENGTIFDDAETVENTAKYISLTKLPHRGIANRGIESPKKINLVISLVIGKMNDDGRCCVDDTDVKNGCNCVNDLMKYDEKKTTVPDIVDDYIKNKERFSLGPETIRDIGYVQKEIDDIADVAPEDSISDEDFEYLDMNKDVTEQRYNSEDDDTVQEGFFSRKNDTKTNSENETVIKIAKDVLEQIKDLTETNSIDVSINKLTGDIKPTDSVIGCDKPPYAEYIPTVNGRELRFLVQINCEELKTLEGFPHEGLLQFWIDDGYDDTGSYVVYYKSASNNNVDELDFNKPDSRYENDWPMIDEFVGRLSFKSNKQTMSVCDDRFDELFVPEYNKLAKRTGINEIKMFWDLPKDVIKQLESELPDLVNHGWGHRVGGYPAFTQSDPRYGKNKDKLIQLLQLDTDQNIIQWGDSGVAHFFISEDDLKNLKFDNVLYHWDCC